VDTEGFPIAIDGHPADMQDRDGAPGVIRTMLEKAPTVQTLGADGGYAGDKLRSRLRERRISDLLEILQKPNNIKSFTVLYYRWVVARTFAWLAGCRRRRANDGERTLERSWAS